jgi:NAD(P)-dependent dehydrogenase (short-subunit alcohol dehydrogenase family)
MDLSSKVALLTGARRVGAVVAAALARRGADIAVAYNRSRTEAEQVVAEVRAAGRRAVIVQGDVSLEAGCQAIVEHVAGELGRLDVLVNMASLYRTFPFDQTDAAVWDQQLGVDLRGSFLCSKAAVPFMRKQGGGRIINFADWVAASERPRYKGYVAYYVAKAGVKALTEALALELAGDNILVNAIAPGPVLAPEDLPADQKKAVEDATPLKRWGGAEEIAKIVLALIESDFVTGETIRVDGGRHVY